MCFKYIFFIGHLLLIKSSLFFIYRPVLILNSITIISWYINDNNCILTQIEDKLFDETLIDIYNRQIGKDIIIYKYRVPWYHRYFMYTQFLVGVLYHYSGINLF